MGVCRQRECTGWGVCRQRECVNSVSRLGSVKGGVMGMQAEGVYWQRECAGGTYTQADKSAHGDKDGLGPFVVSGQS